MENHDRLMVATVIIALLAVVAWGASYGWSSSAAQNPQFASTSSGSKIMINTTKNGYNISNISQTNPFTVTINGSLFTGYVSYIEQRSTGLALNGSVYILNISQPALVRRTSNNAFYAELTKSFPFAKTPTVDITLYSAGAQPPPSVDNVYNLTANVPFTLDIANTSASVTIVSATSQSVKLVAANDTGIVTKLPYNYTPLAILNTSITSNSSLNTSINIKYPCSLLSSSLSPYTLNVNGTWSRSEDFVFKIAACTIVISVPKRSVTGLFERQQSTAASTSSTAATSVASTTVQSTTIPATAQVGQQRQSYSLGLVVALIIIILAIVGIMYYIGRQSKGNRKGKR